jgi:enoyl-CoA hydratase
LACDITVAAEGTLFTHPGWQYVGPTGDFGLWIQTVGVKKAEEMMLTGIPIDAQEALRVGLVNKVVPLDRLEEETMEMAEVISHRPFDGIVMGKAHFEAALEHLSTSASDYIAHAMQTNIRYEPDEYNLFRERRDRGRTAAIKDRMSRFTEKERLSV